MRRSMTTVAALCAALMLAAAPAAHAQGGPWPVDASGWPVVEPDSAMNPGEPPVHAWRTPDQPEFWNLAANHPRLISPYGTSTRIVCVGWRTLGECWQADRNGAPHKLIALPGLMSLSASQIQATYVFPGL